MKLIATIIIAIGGALGINYYMSKQALTKEEFNKYKKEFRAEVDTLKTNQDSLKYKIEYVLNNQKNIKESIDTLKAGQKVIYSEMTKKEPEQTEKSFSEKFKNFFN